MPRENKRFVRNPDFIFRRIVDEIVLIPVHRNIAEVNSIYNLNEIGALIWKHLEKPADIKELCSLVTNAYDVDQENALADLNTFLNDLIAFGAVKIV